MVNIITSPLGSFMAFGKYRKHRLGYLKGAKEEVADGMGFENWQNMRQQLKSEGHNYYSEQNQAALLALQNQASDLKKECDHHYKIIEGDEINSFLSVILRRLDNDKLIVLRDALIQRTTELKWEERTDRED